jgi:hypothetical protein
MTRRRLVLFAGLIVLVCLAELPIGIVGIDVRSAAAALKTTLPARLADQEFWKLTSDFSEPDGTFRSDNLLSNEVGLQYVVPELTRTAKSGRVYMGVGPEQNFTYIAAVKPKMAFIVDIRRGNLDLHLMYKALFELSADRAEFVSRLFAKPRPDGLGLKSTAAEIFAAYSSSDSLETLYRENLKAIQDRLVTTHGFALSPDDLQGIEYVYHAFYSFGPKLQYASTGGFGGRNQPTYADLMEGTDADGQARGYLATEERFTLLKDLEAKNLLVPVVGNFAGPKAIRAVGKYLKKKNATVSAFYLSNVEQYLRQDGIWRDFCGNVATLPLDETSTFIRSVRGGLYGGPFGFGLNSRLGAMAAEVKGCASIPPSRR